MSSRSHRSCRNLVLKPLDKSKCRPGAGGQVEKPQTATKVKSFEAPIESLYIYMYVYILYNDQFPENAVRPSRTSSSNPHQQLVRTHGTSYSNNAPRRRRWRTAAKQSAVGALRYALQCSKKMFQVFG